MSYICSPSPVTSISFYHFPLFSSFSLSFHLPWSFFVFTSFIFGLHLLQFYFFLFSPFVFSRHYIRSGWQSTSPSFFLSSPLVLCQSRFQSALLCLFICPSHPPDICCLCPPWLHLNSPFHLFESPSITMISSFVLICKMNIYFSHRDLHACLFEETTSYW